MILAVLGPWKPSSATCLHDGLRHALRAANRRSTGSAGGEGVFSVLVWLADNYVLQGRQTRGAPLFERPLSLRTDLGLLSAKKYDPRTRRLLGNFPRRSRHVSLANTAANLAAAVGRGASCAIRSAAPRPTLLIKAFHRPTEPTACRAASPCTRASIAEGKIVPGAEVPRVFLAIVLGFLGKRPPHGPREIWGLPPPTNALENLRIMTR